MAGQLGVIDLDTFECFAGQVQAEFSPDLPPDASPCGPSNSPSSLNFALEFLPDADPDILAQFSCTLDGVALGAHLLHDGELLLCLNSLGATDCLTWSSLSGTSSVGQGSLLSPYMRCLFRCLVRASYTGQHRAAIFLIRP